MRTTSRIIGTIVGVTLLTAALSACEEKESTDALSSATTTATEAAESPEVDATPAGAETSAPEPDLPEPSDDDASWTGPGEDPATMEDGPSLVDYETLPGDCPNDVPMPRVDYDPNEVMVENLLDDECLVIIDAKGDSLSVADDISAQLSDAGFEQGQQHSSQTGPDAINVFSYVTNTHEVYVTVSGNDASGVIIRYALTDPSRGNG